jgi:epsilon-lactone hydrolase
MASDQSKRLTDMLRAAPRPEPGMPVAARRQNMESYARPLHEDCKAEPVTAGGVPAEWISAPGAGETTILYLHGGGYTTGSLVTHRELAGRISRATGARVLLLDYRLAPEHPFPAAVDDAVAAYRWLLEQGAQPQRIVVSGDSAGGGLTLATLVAIRDRGLPAPAGGACISPWTDLAMTGESMTSRAALDPMVQRETLIEMSNAYLGDADPASPLASPLHADLAGLPPLLIQVGTSETLFDDATRFDARARAAGVQVRLRPYDEQVHVWHMFAGMLPEGQAAIDEIGAFVRDVTA